VLNANQSVGRYWLRVRGLMDCDQRFNSVHQAAIISYEGADLSKDPEAPVGYSNTKRIGKVCEFNNQIKSVIKIRDFIATELNESGIL
jgi:hypothetical protein